MKLSVLAFLLASLPLLGQTTSTDRPTIPNLPDVNPQLLQLVVEDQWDRGNDMFGGRQINAPSGIDVSKRDEGRHVQVRELLRAGRLKTGRDYTFAAFIFQHSIKAGDLMFGHVLAVTAVAKGGDGNDGMAKWLAAATLDRYLHTIGQPQVFGTQFYPTDEKRWTMAPYSRRTLSDAERALWCVVPLADQEQILKNFQNGKPLAPTQIKDCR